MGTESSDYWWEERVADAEFAERSERARESSEALALSVDVARHVLFKAGDALGVDGGHFVNALLATIDRADLANRRKLATEFPAYVSAWLAAKDAAGLESLRQLVKATDAQALGVALSKAGL